MNKTDLIDAIAESADISKAAAGRALDGFVDAVTVHLFVLYAFGASSN